MKVYKSVVKPLSPGMNFFQNKRYICTGVLIVEAAKAAYTDESLSSTTQRIFSSAAKNIKLLTAPLAETSNFDFATSSGY
jgi:hypothetical protein